MLKQQFDVRQGCTVFNKAQSSRIKFSRSNKHILKLDLQYTENMNHLSNTEYCYN